MIVLIGVFVSAATLSLLVGIVVGVREIRKPTGQPFTRAFPWLITPMLASPVVHLLTAIYGASR